MLTSPSQSGSPWNRPSVLEPLSRKQIATRRMLEVLSQHDGTHRNAPLLDLHWFHADVPVLARGPLGTVVLTAVNKTQDQDGTRGSDFIGRSRRKSTAENGLDLLLVPAAGPSERPQPSRPLGGVGPGAGRRVLNRPWCESSLAVLRPNLRLASVQRDSSDAFSVLSRRPRLTAPELLSGRTHPSSQNDRPEEDAGSPASR